MKTSDVILLFVCIGFGFAEPPPSYFPPQLSNSYGAPGIDLLAGSGQGYHAIGSGYQESEGAHLDPQLLHKIKEILLDQENQAANHGHGHGFGSTLSPVYGPPITLYGVPSSRAVGIELGHIAQSLQVAQFHQASQTPSVSYGVPALPSSTYGAPSHFSNYIEPSILSPPPLQISHSPVRRPSNLYGAPSHHSQTILLIQPRTPNLHSKYIPPRHNH